MAPRVESVPLVRSLPVEFSSSLHINSSSTNDKSSNNNNSNNSSSNRQHLLEAPSLGGGQTWGPSSFASSRAGASPASIRRDSGFLAVPDEDLHLTPVGWGGGGSKQQGLRGGEIELLREELESFRREDASRRDSLQTFLRSLQVEVSTALRVADQAKSMADGNASDIANLLAKEAQRDSKSDLHSEAPALPPEEVPSEGVGEDSTDALAAPALAHQADQEALRKDLEALRNDCGTLWTLLLGNSCRSEASLHTQDASSAQQVGDLKQKILRALQVGSPIPEIANGESDDREVAALSNEEGSPKHVSSKELERLESDIKELQDHCRRYCLQEDLESLDKKLDGRIIALAGEVCEKTIAESSLLAACRSLQEADKDLEGRLRTKMEEDKEEISKMITSAASAAQAAATKAEAAASEAVAKTDSIATNFTTQSSESLAVLRAELLAKWTESNATNSTNTTSNSALEARVGALEAGFDKQSTQHSRLTHDAATFASKEQVGAVQTELLSKLQAVLAEVTDMQNDARSDLTKKVSAAEERLRLEVQSLCQEIATRVSAEILQERKAQYEREELQTSRLDASKAAISSLRRELAADMMILREELLSQMTTAWNDLSSEIATVRSAMGKAGIGEKPRVRPGEGPPSPASAVSSSSAAAAAAATAAGGQGGSPTRLIADDDAVKALDEWLKAAEATTAGVGPASPQKEDFKVKGGAEGKATSEKKDGNNDNEDEEEEMMGLRSSLKGALAPHEVERRRTSSITFTIKAPEILELQAHSNESSPLMGPANDPSDAPSDGDDLSEDDGEIGTALSAAAQRKVELENQSEQSEKDWLGCCRAVQIVFESLADLQDAERLIEEKLDREGVTPQAWQVVLGRSADAEGSIFDELPTVEDCTDGRVVLPVVLEARAAPRALHRGRAPAPAAAGGMALPAAANQGRSGFSSQALEALSLADGSPGSSRSPVLVSNGLATAGAHSPNQSQSSNGHHSPTRPDDGGGSGSAGGEGGGNGGAAVVTNGSTNGSSSGNHSHSNGGKEEKEETRTPDAASPGVVGSPNNAADPPPISPDHRSPSSTSADAAPASSTE